MPRRGELHGIKDEKYKELSSVGRARSINGHFLSIEKAIKSHLEKSNDKDSLKEKYIKRLNGIIEDLKK